MCRTLFDRLAERAPAVDVITPADVERYADVDHALAGFYDEAVAAAVATSADLPAGGSLLTARLTETGIHRVVASGRDGTTGPFSLRIRLQTVDVADRTIEPPGAVEATIGAPDEVDVYSFEGAKDAVVRVTMTATGDVDANLVLVSPSGAGFYDDDGGGASNAALALLLPETGTYSVRASSTGSSTGTYRLGLEFLEPEPLARNAGGEVDARRPVQVHLVRSPDGGLATFRLVPDPRFDATLRLVLADATVLDDTNEEANGGAERLVEPIVPNATYLLLVASNDPTAGGSYSLALDLRPPVPLGDGTVSADLAADEAGDVYVVDADAAQVATISVRADPSMVVRVEVFAPDGAPLTGAQEVREGEDVAFAVRLPARGQYLVSVSPSSPGAPGARYSLGVTGWRGDREPPERARPGSDTRHGGRISPWTGTAERGTATGAPDGDRSTTFSTRPRQRRLREGGGRIRRLPRRRPAR